MGSQFPDQALKLHPLRWKHSLNHWATREVPYFPKFIPGWPLRLGPSLPHVQPAPHPSQVSGCEKQPCRMNGSVNLRFLLEDLLGHCWGSLRAGFSSPEPVNLTISHCQSKTVDCRHCPQRLLCPWEGFNDLDLKQHFSASKVSDVIITCHPTAETFPPNDRFIANPKQY